MREWYHLQPSSTAVQDIAKSFHDQMAPSEKSSDFRSEFRIAFIAGLLQKATKLAAVITQDFSWEKACSGGPNGSINPEAMVNHPLILEHLIQPAHILMEQLERQPKKPRNTKDGPRNTQELLLLVFDEAASLWVRRNKRDIDGTHFFVLRRVLWMLKETPIWSFFLSTQSSTETLLPSWELENSDRVKAGELTILEPFLALPLDVAASKELADNCNAELRKPISKFPTAEHMTMFGRPLWRAFLKAPMKLRVIALQKLIRSKRYNPKNVNHVFATLASRLCLDVCMERTEAIALAHKAVNSHLRIILSFEPTQRDNLETDDNQTVTCMVQSTPSNIADLEALEDGDTQYACSLDRMVTTTPSEPVVAEAVADLLCGNKSNWTTSIAVLANDLLSGGLIQKGTKGELFARLLCILARDFHFKEQLRQMNTERETIPFPYAEPFSIKSFLRSLFNGEWLQQIMDFTPTKPNTRQWKNSQTASFSEVFDRGFMNFTHFTSTDVPLQGSTMSDLLHNLLRQQAALQLAFPQPVWDILIPVYFGDLDSDYDPARASALLISVRNRIRPSKFSLQSDSYHYAQFFHTDDPILFILMDLGTTQNEVVVSGLPKAQNTRPKAQNTRPKAKNSRSQARKSVMLKQHLFGIHALGVDTKTYGCFQDSEMWNAGKKLLDQVIQMNSREIRKGHDELCQQNKRFNYHTWESRFPVLQGMSSEEELEELDAAMESAVAEELDGDVLMEELE